MRPEDYFGNGTLASEPPAVITDDVPAFVAGISLDSSEDVDGRDASSEDEEESLTSELDAIDGMHPIEFGSAESEDEASIADDFLDMTQELHHRVPRDELRKGARNSGKGIITF